MPGAAAGGIAVLPAAPIGIAGIAIVMLVGCVAGPDGIALGVAEAGGVFAAGVVEGDVVV